MKHKSFKNVAITLPIIDDTAVPNFDNFRAGITTVPVVPWEAPAARDPRSTAKLLPKRASTFVNFLGENDGEEKCTP